MRGRTTVLLNPVSGLTARLGVLRCKQFKINIMYTVCTETGSQNFTDLDSAMKLFKRLESKGKEAAIYKGGEFITKTGFTDTNVIL